MTERELEMLQPNWLVDVSNWRELGEAIATFNQFIGNYTFTGVAEQVTENGQTHLEIHLFWNHHDVFRCSVCNKIPENASRLNPVVCTACGAIVCDACYKAHEKGHWRQTEKDKVPF